MEQKSFILEDGEQFDLTDTQVKYLLGENLIYDSGEGYYHLNPGIEYVNIELALKGMV